MSVLKSNANKISGKTAEERLGTNPESKKILRRRVGASTKKLIEVLGISFVQVEGQVWRTNQR